jgi:hypothetical protein
MSTAASYLRWTLLSSLGQGSRGPLGLPPLRWNPFDFAR